MTHFRNGRKMARSKADQLAVYHARLDAEVAGRAAMVEMVRLCIAAGRPELVPVFLVEELTVDQARAALAAFDRPN